MMNNHFRVLILFMLACFVSGYLSANLRFSNRSSVIAIKASNSALKISNVSKVSGWTQESIVKDFGYNDPSQWVEQYTDGVVIAQTGGTSIPATNLVYSNSNAIAYWSPINRATSNAVVYQEGWNIRQDAMIRTDSNAFAYGIRNNSNAIIYVSTHGSSALTTQNSNAIVYLNNVARTDSNAFAYGIRNNSNAIVRLSNVSPSGLVVQNSNAIAYWSPINRATSNAVVYQEGWNIRQDAMIRTDSNAFAYGIRNNSNAIIYVSTHGSSALTTQNSNAIIYLNNVVRTDSNAFAYEIRNNSNAIIRLTGTVPSSLLQSTSNAVVWLDQQMQTIDHGPNNIQINTSTYSMLFDYYLSDDHLLDIQASCEFDGGGHFMYFAKDNANVLQIAAGSNVVLKNVVLKNFSDVGVQLGAGATLTFGEGTTIELNDGQTISTPWVFDGNAVINAFGNCINIDTQNIQIMQQGNLTIQNAGIQGLSANNLRCVGDARITLKDSSLYTDRDFSFTSGALIVDGDVVVSGTNTFSYVTNKQSTIDSNSVLILAGGIVFNYAPLTNDRDLIAMQDSTSNIYLRGCALSSSTTGMRLTKGSLTVDLNNYLVNAGATSVSEGVCFGDGVVSDDLTVNVLPGASFDILSGILDIQNVN